MKYRRLINGDYTFGNGKYCFLEDVDAVVQAVQTSLLLLKGEWWENTDEGLPLFDEILNNPYVYGQNSSQAIDLLIKRTILKVTGVASIEEYESSFLNRQLTINCTINTVYGPATLEVSF